MVLCRQLDLFGHELVAVDGTRIKAVSNKTRNSTRTSLAKFIQDADEKLAGYMKRLDEGDADDDRTPGGGSGPRGDQLAEKIAAIQGKRDRHKEMVAELDRTGADQISLTDPDARAMARDMLPRIHVIGKLAGQRRPCRDSSIRRRTRWRRVGVVDGSELLGHQPPVARDRDQPIIVTSAAFPQTNGDRDDRGVLKRIESWKYSGREGASTLRCGMGLVRYLKAYGNMIGGNCVTAGDKQGELQKLLLEALQVAEELGCDLVALYIINAIDTLPPRLRR